MSLSKVSSSGRDIREIDRDKEWSSRSDFDSLARDSDLAISGDRGGVLLLCSNGEPASRNIERSNSDYMNIKE